MSDSLEDLRAAFEPVRRAAEATGLPGIEAGSWYGTPGLLVAGKGFARMKDARTLVLRCPIETKEMLIEAAPEIYFETDHYKGYPAILVRLAVIDAAELGARLAEAWRMRAPKKLLRVE